MCRYFRASRIVVLTTSVRRTSCCWTGGNDTTHRSRSPVMSRHSCRWEPSGDQVSPPAKVRFVIDYSLFRCLDRWCLRQIHSVYWHNFVCNIRCPLLNWTTPNLSHQVTMSPTIWAHSLHGWDSRYLPITLWADTRALEKTSRLIVLCLAQEYHWSDLLWHGAAGGYRYSSESIFLEDVDLA